jgi:hypothetical protein
MDRKACRRERSELVVGRVGRSQKAQGIGRERGTACQPPKWFGVGGSPFTPKSIPGEC